MAVPKTNPRRTFRLELNGSLASLDRPDRDVQAFLSYRVRDFAAGHSAAENNRPVPRKR